MRQMERNRMNMQDVRNELDVKTIRSKIEKSHLVRIGHIARMSDERLVKPATMGWIRRMETGRKPRKRKITTLMYWHRLHWSTTFLVPGQKYSLLANSSVKSSKMTSVFYF